MTPDALKRWREKNTYSQSQLASALGVATMTVSRWERGSREVPSFLSLALRALELEGGEKKSRSKKQSKKEGGEK